MEERKRKETGRFYEQQACRFLESQGLRLIIQNFQCSSGEIDLIMQDREDIVFVEVRTRNQNGFGNALESVTHHKQKKILKAAVHYLQIHNWFDKVNSRFDVVGISQGKVDWIKNAFSIETI